MIVNKVKCVKNPNKQEIKLLDIFKADIPKIGTVYTLSNFFHHLDKTNIKKSKYVMQFEEINHGELIGYNAKYFIPVDDKGNGVDEKIAMNALIRITK